MSKSILAFVAATLLASMAPASPTCNELDNENCVINQNPDRPAEIAGTVVVREKVAADGTVLAAEIMESKNVIASSVKPQDLKSVNSNFRKVKMDTSSERIVVGPSELDKAGQGSSNSWYVNCYYNYGYYRPYYSYNYYNYHQNYYYVPASYYYWSGWRYTYYNYGW